MGGGPFLWQPLCAKTAFFLFSFDARFAECWKIELAGMNFIYNITGMNAESNML